MWLGAAVVNAILLVAACHPGPTTVSPPAALAGRLVYVNVDGFWSYDLASRAASKLVAFPDGTFASAPSVSPDGQQIAFNLSRYGTSATDPGWTATEVMGVDGSGQREIIRGVAAGETPAWDPTGTALYVTTLGDDKQDQISRVRLADATSEVIVGHADSPSLSPDGRTLAFVVTQPNSYTQALYVWPTDAPNAALVFGQPSATLVQSPRFSPDGRHVVFAAAPAYGIKPGTGAASPPFLPRTSDLVAWLQPSVAYAHSVPFDIWMVDVDGSNARRLTNVDQHVDFPTWSADGRWIAFTGEPGLYLINADGTQLSQLSQEGLPSGLTWTP
jgi:TolB protein